MTQRTQLALNIMMWMSKVGINLREFPVDLLNLEEQTAQFTVRQPHGEIARNLEKTGWVIEQDGGDHGAYELNYPGSENWIFLSVRSSDSHTNMQMRGLYV